MGWRDDSMLRVLSARVAHLSHDAHTCLSYHLAIPSINTQPLLIQLSSFPKSKCPHVQYLIPKRAVQSVIISAIQGAMFSVSTAECLQAETHPSRLLLLSSSFLDYLEYGSDT